MEAAREELAGGLGGGGGQVRVPVGEVPGDDLVARGGQEVTGGAERRTDLEAVVPDRIMIRNLRLMLEGHCVAHPTATRMTVTLNGDWDDSLEQLFTTDLHWLMHGQEVGELTILGQPIRLPNLSGGAAVYLEQDDVDEIRAAFAAGTAAGLEGLVNFLREMGLTPELLTELRAAAKADEAQSDGPSRWTRVRALLARVATDAGTEAIGGAVATAAVAFLGG